MRAVILSLATWSCVSLAGVADEIDTLTARSHRRYRAGDYAGAVELAEQAVAVAEREFGADAVETAMALNVLAIHHDSQGQYARAEPLFERIVAICEKSIGPDHPDTAVCLGNLAALYSAQRRYAEAVPLFERALAICETSLGPDHSDTVLNLDKLAEVYQNQGQYDRAAPLLERVLAITEKSLGRDHPDTATSLNNLAELYRVQGLHSQAEPLFQRALAIFEKAFGPGHPETVTSLNNLAVAYLARGRYALAEPLLKRAVAIKEKALGPEHPATAVSLVNLASLYKLQGRYASAQPLYERAHMILEQALGPDHPDIAASLNNLGSLFWFQGQFERAEPLLKRAVAIVERTLGSDHPDTAASLNNLAVIYTSQRRYAQAEPLYRRALAIRERTIGPDHPETAASLSGLAILHEFRGEYSQAEPLLSRALTIFEGALGPDHPDTATSLANLAALHWSQRRFADAAPLAGRSLVICEKSYGPDHPKTTFSLNNLVVLEAALGRLSAANSLCDRARRGIRRHVVSVLPALSAAEQSSFLRTQDAEPFHGALTLGLLQPKDAGIASLSAGWLANGKAVGEEAASQRIILARQSGYPATVSAVTALTSVRAELGRLVQMKPSPEQAAAYRERLAALQVEEHRLIHEIGGQLAALDRDEPWVEIDGIRRNIPGSSVLVDIARFPVFDFDARREEKTWQPARYAAWITPPAGAGDVTIVDLGDAEEIDALVAEYRRAIEARDADLPAAEPLAAKVLRPILAALASGDADVEELILSPDGALWLVPWQALPLADGSFAIERYAIRTVTSARDLVPPPADAAPRGEASPPLVVADPAFDEPPAERGAAVEPGSDSLTEAAGRVLERVEPLPATRREAEAARASLEKIAGAAPSIRLGREASASALQREAVRPRIVVLATHGFFLPDQEVEHDERFMLASARGIAGTRPLDAATGRPVEDPLLRCGLLFAGANLPAAERAGDDGVLTGAEIVGLDLLGTDLVVLSACDTGVGRVDVGEGVAGLRQAFQIAGAKSVVATLWQVPDAESAAIMAAFYANVANGESPSKALRGAQLAFIRARREDGNDESTHPYFWAAYGITGR